MAGKSGTQDWFYHAPKRRSPNAGPKDYPAPSQIPMLSNAIIEEDPRDETGMMRGWIRETDSKYVILAKQRGRRDLLQIRERPPPSKEAKPYPRVDWFDHNPELEDPQDEHTARKVYLPDYMVHEEYNPDTHEDEMEGKRPPPRRAPYSLQDKLTVFQRDGDSASDKKHVKLPEIKSTGKKTSKKDRVKKDEGKSKGQNRYANMPNQEPQEKAVMGKLLNFGYQHEWYDQREKFYEHQKKKHGNQPPWEQDAGQGSRLTTEYRDEINVGKKEGKGQGSPRTKRVAMTKKAESMRKAKEEGEEKGLFKLSKFDKVGPRINSHWSAGPRLSDQEKMDTYTQQLEEMAHA